MKAKRLLFLVMAICLASGVKAQFYDSADDIYFYLEESKNGKTISNKYVMVFNFDGEKGCLLEHASIEDIQNHLMKTPDYYVELEESKVYRWEYVSSSLGTCYKSQGSTNIPGGITWYSKYTALFSSDRNTLTFTDETTAPAGKTTKITILRKVDKSYFKVGRSRTPSGTIYE